MVKLQRRVGLWLAIVMLAVALAPAAPEAPAKAQPEALAVNKPLAEEQLKLIDQALGDLDRSYKNGELNLTNPGFSRWERRRVDALRAAGAGKAEVIAALERFVKRMKDLEGYTKTLYERDQVTRGDVANARYERLEAEIWLNQEKAR